jgi:hypothetical protein
MTTNAAIVSDTSLSSDSARANVTGAKTATDTSLSTTMTPLGTGPGVVQDYSLSTSSVSARQAGVKLVVDTSLSTDAAFVSVRLTASDTSLSSTTTPIANLLDHRSVTDTSLSTDTATLNAQHATAFVFDTSLSGDALHLHLYARASDTSISTERVTAVEQAVGIQIHVRERAPLRLTMNIFSPDTPTFAARWAADDPNPINNPSSITFSTVMPGGHEQGSCVLERDPSRNYPDTEEFSKVQVLGVGGAIASEGRLESLPSTGGDSAQLTPTWTGYQALLSDDNSAREVFVDRSITSWEGPSLARQVQLLSGAAFGGNACVSSGPSVAPDYTTSFPSLELELSGTWSQLTVVEAWYDAHGLPLGHFYMAWDNFGLTNWTMTPAGGPTAGIGVLMALSTDDQTSGYDPFYLTASSGSSTLNPTTTRPWAFIQLWTDEVPGGQDNVNYQFFATALGVYGDHGLPLYGPVDSQNAYGILASDVAAYVINKWAPKLGYTTGVNGTIRPSAFPIPQLVFLDPVMASDMLKQAFAYELLDWAVWDGPTFYLNPRSARGRKWRSRIGPAQLQEAGPQVSRIFNGVVVQFSDVSGINRTYGPPGADTNYTDSSLYDNDPENPATEAGINRYALVTMQTSTPAAALQIGQMFLQEQKLLDSEGQATLTGHVQDERGVYWPAYMVRAGDQISFTDAADPSYRRIVHTSYDDSSKANAIQLDQPPDSLTALLQRLNIVLAPFGIG